MADPCTIATEAIAASYRAEFATGSLKMTCGRCTAVEYFATVIRNLADMLARAKGWRFDDVRGQELCPKCASL